RVGRPLTLVPASEREIGLEAENRPQLARPGLGVELPRPVQVAVIGDGERVHAQRVDPVEQLRDPVGAVEEGVLAMRVEVDERHTASGRYRRSRALSKPRRAGYFAPDARAGEPVCTGPDDGPFSSRDRGRRGAGTAIVARPAGRAGAPRGWRDRVPAARGRDGTPVREPVVPAHGAPVTGRRRGGGVGAGRAVGRVVAGRGDGYAQRARGP